MLQGVSTESLKVVIEICAKNLFATRSEGYPKRYTTVYSN